MDLSSVLPMSTIMIVTVSATTTAGKPLDADTLSRVMEACDLAVQLDAARAKVPPLDRCERRMCVRSVAHSQCLVAVVSVVSGMVGGE